MLIGWLCCEGSERIQVATQIYQASSLERQGPLRAMSLGLAILSIRGQILHHSIQQENKSMVCTNWDLMLLINKPFLEAKLRKMSFLSCFMVCNGGAGSQILIQSSEKTLGLQWAHSLPRGPHSLFGLHI